MMDDNYESISNLEMQCPIEEPNDRGGFFFLSVSPNYELLVSFLERPCYQNGGAVKVSDTGCTCVGVWKPPVSITGFCFSHVSQTLAGVADEDDDGQQQQQQQRMKIWQWRSGG